MVLDRALSWDWYFNDTGSDINCNLNFPYRADSWQVRLGGVPQYVFANLLESFPKFKSISHIILHSSLF